MAEKPEGFNTKATEVEELTEAELKFGYWFVTHRDQLRRALIIALIVFSVATFGYAIFDIIRFYGFYSQEHQQSLNTLSQNYIDVGYIHEVNAIQPLQVLSRHVLPAGDGRVDIAARVVNPNTKWALKNVAFQFSHGGSFYDSQESFVLPGEEKYLLLLNVEGPRGGTPQIFFQDQQWQRVINYQDWGPQRLNFLITNKKFLSARQSELSGQLPVSQAEAEITNATAYNYNEVEVQIALLSGSRLTGISKVALQDFSSGDKRQVVSRWTERLSAVSNVEIIPSVNIIDQSVYSEFEGEFDPSFLELDRR